MPQSGPEICEGRALASDVVGEDQPQRGALGGTSSVKVADLIHNDTTTSVQPSPTDESQRQPSPSEFGSVIDPSPLLISKAGPVSPQVALSSINTAESDLHKITHNMETVPPPAVSSSTPSLTKDTKEALANTADVSSGVSENVVQQGEALGTLMQAVKKGDDKLAENLLEGSAYKIDEKDSDGWTALMWAAYKGLGVTKKLMEKGADVNSKDNNGWTALMKAADRGHCDILEMLLQGGAEVNAKNNHGWTALTYAYQENRFDVVKILLRYGVEVTVEGLMMLTVAQLSDMLFALGLPKSGNKQSKVERLLNYTKTAGEEGMKRRKVGDEGRRVAA